MAHESSSIAHAGGIIGSGAPGAGQSGAHTMAAQSTPAHRQHVSLPTLLSVLQDDLRMLIDAGANLQIGAVDGRLVVVVSAASALGWQDGEITVGGVPATSLMLAELERER